MPWVEIAGLRIHYEDTGAGPAMVLGHSFLLSSEMWRHQVPAFARSFRVINVDFRGHGRSQAPASRFTLEDLADDLVALLDRLGIERAIWTGLSVGGMVALRAALRHPARVSALVLLDTHAGRETLRNRLRYRAMAAGARLLGVRPFLPAVLPLFFGRTSLRERGELVGEWRDRIVAGVQLASLGRGVAALVGRGDLAPRLREIRAPALVLVGEEDLTLPPAYSRQLAAGLPGASWLVIPGAGHLSALERPEAVNTAILEFLAPFSA